MRFWGCVIGIWVALAGAGLTQDKPQLDVVFEETEAIPGQPLTLRLTVLVPTFMPEPPVWPDLESPNLMVRLPEKASSPTSKTVNGETWSGISRRYQITPMVLGSFQIAPGSVQVTYRDATGGELLQEVLPVPEISVVGILPEGAEGLDPFIAAQELSLTQTIDGETEGLDAGASFSRVLTAKIKGVSPIFVPPMTPQEAPDGLRAYPENPVVEDKEDRGILSGTRSEKTVYVAENAVDGMLPEITIRWYNLASNTIEEATVPAVNVQAEAPAGSVNVLGEDARANIDLRVLVAAGLFIVALAVLWFARGLIAAKRAGFIARWQVSEAYAWRWLLTAVHARDLGAARRAFDIWRARAGTGAIELDGSVETAFLGVGSGFFGQQASAELGPQWRALETDLKQLRRALHGQRPLKYQALAALNPVSAARK
ncbi:BatD family protein [Shimia sp. R9_3]|uniref:BatD family protein n=1 Tax=Shimia sp. R9_3 TaxID=2821113 RepID=UPI001ADBC1C7|nr:BatD family protein [Shimia sp. R9_3]MBO9400415.1 BatD family protein [Shimia sp. R9_3]